MLLYSPISAVGACSSKIIACSNKIYAYSNVYTTAFNLNMKTVKKAFMMGGGSRIFFGMMKHVACFAGWFILRVFFERPGNYCHSWADTFNEILLKKYRSLWSRAKSMRHGVVNWWKRKFFIFV